MLKLTKFFMFYLSFSSLVFTATEKQEAFRIKAELKQIKESKEYQEFQKATDRQVELIILKQKKENIRNNNLLRKGADLFPEKQQVEAEIDRLNQFVLPRIKKYESLGPRYLELRKPKYYPYTQIFNNILAVEKIGLAGSSFRYAKSCGTSDDNVNKNLYTLDRARDGMKYYKSKTSQLPDITVYKDGVCWIIAD